MGFILYIHNQIFTANINEYMKLILSENDEKEGT